MHGTGVRDIAPTLDRLGAGLRRTGTLRNVRVRGAEWGRHVGPDPLDPTSALPPALTRGTGDEETAGQAELWDLLLADPFLELRLLAADGRATDGDAMAIGRETPDLILQERLLTLRVSEETLARSELAQAELGGAARELGTDEMLGRAATAVGEAGEAELLGATARALVAVVLGRHQTDSADRLPRACIDAAARAQLVDELVDRLRAGMTRGLLGRAVSPIVAPLATRIAVRRRAAFTTSAADFARDIAFYVQRGQGIRDYLQEQLRGMPQDEPVVLLGHSLGGIAAVDLLAARDPQDPTWRIDLLVTVGSQAPLLYLMDALDTLQPQKPQLKPFTPWLNVYDRDDLLAFCAERVWPGTPGINDMSVSSSVPFPMSHSAYWVQDRLYDLLAEFWPAV